MKWSDNTPMDYPPGNPFKLTGGNMAPWYINEPNNDAMLEFCSFMATSTPDVGAQNRWFDYRCNNMLPSYVCKKSAV
uniref:C-type lectin domain-containing protein n=2 Tax=Panagrolaimus sp. JU765 TaxID=591449 RepID=A0AC34RP96_9BILA